MKTAKSLKTLVKRKIFVSVLSIFLILIICLTGIDIQNNRRREAIIARRSLDSAARAIDMIFADRQNLPQLFERIFNSKKKDAGRINRIAEEIQSRFSLWSLSIRDEDGNTIVDAGRPAMHAEKEKYSRKGEFSQRRDGLILTRLYEHNDKKYRVFLEYRYTESPYNRLYIIAFFISIIVIILFAMGLSSNVTATIEELDEKNMQLKEIYRERAEDWRTISAHIAHEIRNPLSGIRMFSELLERKYHDKEPESEYIENIIKQVDNLNNIITNFLNFSRPPKIRFIKASMNRCTEAAFESLGNLAAEVSFKCEGNTEEFMFDFDQMKQVFLNILKNSVEAMAETKDKKILVKVSETNGMAEISVSDSGPGIEQEMLSKLFHPFVTGKTTGTGLGLSIVSGIVKAHDGKITAENIEGGAKITVQLPVRKENENTHS